MWYCNWLTYSMIYLSILWFVCFFLFSWFVHWHLCSHLLFQRAWTTFRKLSEVMLINNLDSNMNKLSLFMQPSQVWQHTITANWKRKPHEARLMSLRIWNLYQCFPPQHLTSEMDGAVWSATLRYVITHFNILLPLELTISKFSWKIIDLNFCPSCSFIHCCSCFFIQNSFGGDGFRPEQPGESGIQFWEIHKICLKMEEVRTLVEDWCWFAFCSWRFYHFVKYYQNIRNSIEFLVWTISLLPVISRIEGRVNTCPTFHFNTWCLTSNMKMKEDCKSF